MPGKIQRYAERLPLLTDQPVLGAILALGAAGCGLGLRLIASPWMPPGYPFLTFFPVIILTTLLLGWKHGLLSAFASGALAWYFFIAQLRSFSFDSGVVVALGFFLFVVSTEILLIHWLQRFIASAARERETNRMLAENRELLFRELQHRVSNNLQVVAALLTLQKRDITDEKARGALDEAANRMALIGKISRQLHDPNGAQLGMKPFLDSLCSDLLEASGRKDVSCQCEVEDGIALQPDAAIPVALIIAESISNALEHGFTPGKGGEIGVRFARATPGKMALEIKDNGRGLPQDFTIEKSHSLGLRIALMLSRQLGGELMLVQEDRTTMRLILPNP